MKKFYERYWENQEELSDFPYKWPKIKHLIPKNKKLRLLDFGCGKGIVLNEILKLNPKLDVTGVDTSQTAIAYISKRFPKETFFVVKEGEKLPFKSNTFDFITALDVIEHIYDTEFILKELARVLRPNGKMLITVPFYGLIKNLLIALIGFDFVYNPRSPHIRFYTQKSLLREVKSAGLTSLEIGFFGRFYPIWRGMFCLCKK